MKPLQILWLLPALIMAACNHSSTADKPDFLTADIDTTVSPANDFFSFANGGWIKRTPIPESESGWGLGNLVNEEIYTRLRKVNEDAAAQKA
ncbi:MAG TPA: hypothetical protein VNU70_11455, partial [Puia sp.]|nr:hypothetical protein [Puia sp.]